MKYTSQDAENKPRYVPGGDYLVTVIEATETIAKESGAEMIKLKLEVEEHGVRFFDYLVATESSFWKIDTFRKAIGEKVVEGEEVELFADDLLGRQAYATLRVEEFDGRKNNKIDAWLSNVPLHPQKGSALTARSTYPAKSASTLAEVDDDVPF